MSRYLDAIIAWFCGQGVLLIGNLLAYAGMRDGLNVTYIPVYGAEMRGGTANCTVVLSGEAIGSPIIKRPQSLIVLNRPSLDKFQPRLLDGGVQVVNTSLIDLKLAESKRVRTVPVAANDIANALGNGRMANMVALGAFIAATGIVPLAAAIDSLADIIARHYAQLIPKNAEALRAGAEAAAKLPTVRPAAKKPAAKKPAAKKGAGKKGAVKKAPAKKTPAAKTPAAKTPAKKAAVAKAKPAAKKAAKKPAKPAAKRPARKAAKKAGPARKKAGRS